MSLQLAAINKNGSGAINGTLTFTSGQTTQTITVPIVGDILDENNEKFAVNLTSAVNATIADKEGFCTITDDDAPSLRANEPSQ